MWRLISSSRHPCAVRKVKMPALRVATVSVDPLLAVLGSGGTMKVMRRTPASRIAGAFAAQTPCSMALRLPSSRAALSDRPPMPSTRMCTALRPSLPPSWYGPTLARAVDTTSPREVKSDTAAMTPMRAAPGGTRDSSVVDCAEDSRVGDGGTGVSSASMSVRHRRSARDERSVKLSEKPRPPFLGIEAMPSSSFVVKLQRSTGVAPSMLTATVLIECGDV
mmetsp:Transcript_36025/g.113178  ORF Transcript_36025/g.113178 Transcript_36025/m.113178 type:complete len:221 (-) Transcript_36025:1914-2576(-)